MEKAANRAYEMRQKFDLKPGVIINVLTKDDAVNGVWVGKDGAGKADCYSSICKGEAKTTYRHLCNLQQKGLGGMVYTDLSASLQRSGGNEETIKRFGAFVTECGAEEIFCADDASLEDVSLAWCADGASDDKGVVELVLPVWCSKAGMDVTLRLLTCETAASSYFTCFSSTFL